jgi:hypothetical protein
MSIRRDEQTVSHSESGAGETELRVAQTLESSDGHNGRLDLLYCRRVLRQAGRRACDKDRDREA